MGGINFTYSQFNAREGEHEQRYRDCVSRGTLQSAILMMSSEF